MRNYNNCSKNTKSTIAEGESTHITELKQEVANENKQAAITEATNELLNDIHQPMGNDAIDANAEKDPNADVEKAITATVVSSKLNVREKPSRLGEVVCMVFRGNELLVEDIADGWVHIYTSSGAEGYVMEEYIQINK